MSVEGKGEAVREKLTRPDEGRGGKGRAMGGKRILYSIRTRTNNDEIKKGRAFFILRR